MIKVKIPGRGELNIEYVLFDMNGTLTTEGILLESTKKRLESLAKKVKIIILTADTFGKAKETFNGIDVELHIISSGLGSKAKLEFLKNIGEKKCIAVGNGNNDALMLKNAEVGIAILGDEGLSVKACLKSDILVKDIDNAIDILLNGKRIIATLRL